MSNLPLSWFLLSLLAVGIGIKRPDLRRQMIWAGFLVLPVLAIQPLISDGFWPLLTLDQTIIFLLTRATISFFMAAALASIYEGLWRHYFTPPNHPSRRHLLWLMVGPIIFALLKLSGSSFVSCLMVSLLTDLIIVLAARRDLIWDVLFSGLMMGLTYGLVFWVTAAAIPGDLVNLGWFGPATGLNVFGLPIEELIIVILYGALWGPLYVAIKDLQSH
jgi:hypothetical protein